MPKKYKELIDRTVAQTRCVYSPHHTSPQLNSPHSKISLSSPSPPHSCTPWQWHEMTQFSVSFLSFFLFQFFGEFSFLCLERQHQPALLQLTCCLSLSTSLPPCLPLLPFVCLVVCLAAKCQAGVGFRFPIRCIVLLPCPALPPLKS